MKSQSLPIYPRTSHLECSNIHSSDVWVSDYYVAAALKQAKTIDISEKLDGSNVRVYFDGYEDLIIGNRTKVLNKSYQKKETPAKLQFRPLWGWCYEHRLNFRALVEELKSVAVVFGEWMYAVHSIEYTELPDLFLAFDIWMNGEFLDPVRARSVLTECGFHMPPRLEVPLDITVPELYSFNTEAHMFGGKREGIYIKLGDGQKLIDRFKIVRHDFTPRTDFNECEILKNGISRR